MTELYNTLASLFPFAEDFHFPYCDAKAYVIDTGFTEGLITTQEHTALIQWWYQNLPASEKLSVA